MKAPEGFLPVWTEAFRAAGLPPPSLRALEPVAGGSINRAYRAVLADAAGPRTLFCKWNPSAPADFFAREAEGLEALRAAGSPLVIPRVLAVWPPAGEGGKDAGLALAGEGGQSGAAPGAGAARTGPGLLALEWLEPAESGTEDWEAFGRALAALHAAPCRAFGWDRDNYCGLTPQPGGWSREWAPFYAERRIAPLVDRLAAQGALTAADRRTCDRLIARLPALLPHAPAPSLIHGDLWPGNFLASSRGPALVDPAAHGADAEAEWGMMSLFGGFPDRVRAAYEEARPLPAGWRERQPLYRLYHLLNHAALFGGGYLAQALDIARRFA